LFLLFFISLYTVVYRTAAIQQARRGYGLSVIKCRAANSRTTCSEKTISSGCFDSGELHLAAPCPGLSVARLDSERTRSSIPGVILN